ncbi:hypothetical protein A2U01_0101708, partial [Trifolium medium]|nr:hypothetical protein [Trifolium medium]
AGGQVEILSAGGALK